jgi:hypothetical protein
MIELERNVVMLALALAGVVALGCGVKPRDTDADSASLDEGAMTTDCGYCGNLDCNAQCASELDGCVGQAIAECEEPHHACAVCRCECIASDTGSDSGTAGTSTSSGGTGTETGATSTTTGTGS